MSGIRLWCDFLLRWFTPPGLESSKEHLRLVKGSFHPETVREVLDKSEQRREELLGWSDRLDRKLLAVITADGVYVALLLSMREWTPVGMLLAVGLLAFVSLGLAYLAWPPLGFRAVTIDPFVNHLNIHPDDLRRFLIAAHRAANRQIYDLNAWKANKLAFASGSLAAGALITVGYTALGGFL